MQATQKISSAQSTRKTIWLSRDPMVLKTCAPSATKHFAVARPRPLLPPVTSATFSASFFVSMSCFVVSGVV